MKPMRAVVKIPHIVWRDGRPRFVPGPALRALGFRGEDLKDPAGRWLDIRRTEDWAKRRLAEIEARRALPSFRRRGDGGPRGRAGGAPAVTVEDLFEDLWKLKKLRDAASSGALAASTVRDYRVKAHAIEAFDPELWTSPAAALSRAVVLGLHERLWEEKGLAMANGVVAVLRLAYSTAIDRRPECGLVNPCLRLKLPAPRPRVRVASPDEIAALMAAADAAEPAIGDAIMLALMTGQRQGDVLAVREADIEQGRLRLTQAKTGMRVGMRILGALKGRLAGAQARRKAANRLPATFVIDPRTGRPYQADVFRHRFADVRATAAGTCASVADFWFMDLRDTAITWLANAGATIPEIAAISGHSLATVTSILKHYLEANAAQADAGLGKLEAWMEGQGMTL